MNNHENFFSLCFNRTALFNDSSIATCIENPCLQSTLNSALQTGMSNGNCGSTTPSNSSCTLSCINGYDLIGSLTIYCSTGNFSSSDETRITFGDDMIFGGGVCS